MNVIDQDPLGGVAVPELAAIQSMGVESALCQHAVQLLTKYHLVFAVDVA